MSQYYCEGPQNAFLSVDQHPNHCLREEGYRDDEHQLDQGHDKYMRDGLRSLAFRVKNGEILVQQTDKSGELSIMTREEYNSGNGAIPGICDFQTKPNIEWRISVVYRQFFPGFPGFNST